MKGGSRFRLRVNPIACDGRGLCAELFPERVRSDDWGYPIVDGEPFGPDLEPAARKAVKDCPLLALALDEVRADGGPAPAASGPVRPRLQPAARITPPAEG